MDKLFHIHGSNSSPILTDLKAYWKFDDTLVDATGNGNDGTAFNNPSYVEGRVEDAIQLVRASSQYIRVPGNTDLSPGDNADFTVVLWLKLTTNFNVMSILSTFDDAGGGWELQFNTLSNAFKLVGQSDVISSVTPSSGIWYMLSFGYDSSVSKLYLRVNTGSRDLSSATINLGSLFPWFFGINSDAVSIPLNGIIDEVGFWKRLLTDDEITELYNAGTGTTYPF